MEVRSCAHLANYKKACAESVEKLSKNLAHTVEQVECYYCDSRKCNTDKSHMLSLVSGRAAPLKQNLPLAVMAVCAIAFQFVSA